MLIGLLGAVRDPFRSPVPELAPLLSPETRLRPFPSRVPAFPFTPLEQALQQVGHLEAGLAAAAAGCDALVIDSLGDYGLAALRAATPLPVLGPGELGMAAAAAGGRRFGIVTVWPASMNFIPEGLLRTYGHEAACIGMANVGAEAELDRLAGPDGYLAQVRDGAAALIDTIATAIADMAGRGAEAVLLGCTCMSPLAAALAARAPVPVINPLASAVLAAERAGVWGGGERVIARPGRPDLVKRMVEGVADEPAEDCPVCVVASSLGE